MLCYIRIKDYILINNFESDLKGGFTAIIGETGAGKSLILSAINLACGKRVDFDVDKNIKKQAEITLSFKIDKNIHAKKALKQIGLEDSNICTIKRTINKGGKSATTINGVSVKLKDVSYVSSFLIDIFSQNNTTKIFSQENQVSAYDTHSNCFNLQVEISRLAGEYKKIKNIIETHKRNKKDKDERMGLLNYQIDEFNVLDLKEDEYSKLEEEFLLMENSKEYKLKAKESIDIISDDEIGIKSLLSKISKNLHAMDDKRENINNAIMSISDINSIISDMEVGLNSEFDAYDFDDERYYEVSKRIDEINAVSKKNNVTPDDLYSLIEEKIKEYSEFKDNDFNLEEYEERLESIKSNWFEISKNLSKLRLDNKDNFINEVESRLSELKMNESKINIDFKDVSHEINEYGNEIPIMKISTNLGQDYYDLELVMSGGEASRFSLVLQTLLKKENRVIIFDEIDAGIGGLTANNVGDYMRKISKDSQVISITHLPQVVMFSDYQFLVRKNPKNGESITNIIIEPLTSNKLVYEIARMMGHDIINKKIKDQIKETIEVRKNEQ